MPTTRPPPEMTEIRHRFLSVMYGNQWKENQNMYFDYNFSEILTHHNHDLSCVQCRTTSSTWTVRSQTAPDTSYSVVKVTDRCEDTALHAACQLKECGHLCRAMYTCSCYDYRSRPAMVCKHVHAVHSSFFPPSPEVTPSSPVLMIADAGVNNTCKH